MNTKKHHVTIKDIAQELGVSLSTVSRALADRWDVSAETRQLVLDTAQKMNYRPNPIALRLQNQRSRTIGLAVPEFSHSFFSKVIIGIQSVLTSKGYSLLITQSNESKITELNNLRMLEDNLVEGIIMSITCQGGNDQYYQYLIDSGIPMVFFNRIPDHMEAPKIVIEDQKMARIAVEHLIETGRRRIVHLSGPENLNVSSLRKDGYLEALQEAKIEVCQDLIVQAGLQVDSGYQAMKKLLADKTPVDAVFGCNDLTAFGAMRAIKELGLKIPEDIAIVGFSESDSALLVEPPLTSVAQPTFQIGVTAAQIMLAELEKRNNPHRNDKRFNRDSLSTVYLQAKLNIRQSSAKKNKNE